MHVCFVLVLVLRARVCSRKTPGEGTSARPAHAAKHSAAPTAQRTPQVLRAEDGVNARRRVEHPAAAARALRVVEQPREGHVAVEAEEREREQHAVAPRARVANVQVVPACHHDVSLVDDSEHLAAASYVRCVGTKLIQFGCVLEKQNTGKNT
jgi:hypothetical protein